MEVLKPITISIFGTHTAGKRTIGEKVAKILNCSFERELGDILRDNLNVDNHKFGYEENWDDKIFDEEVNRDYKNKDSSHRVVETWHVGNLLWALQRKNKENNQTPYDSFDIKRALCNKTITAIKSEVQQNKNVVFIFLDITAETMRRRRAHNNDCIERLSLKNEYQDTEDLHEFIGNKALEVFHELKLNLPILTIDNNNDDESAIKDVVDKIIDFVKCLE
jgi:shikimate kinase